VHAGFDKRLHALGARKGSNAIHFCVLKVRIFPAPIDGIVVPAQKLSLALHLRAFLTDGTVSHGFMDVVYPKLKIMANAPALRA
jgi:hypothetical protein